MRLAGRVADHRLPGRERGRHDGVLGRHHACLVEEDPLPDEAARLHLVAAVQIDLRAELRECMDVRVEASPPDHVAAGRWHCGPAPAREQRAREQEGGADAACQLLVDVGRDQVGRVHAHLVLARPFDVGAELREQLDHRLHIADPRDVRQRHRLLREEARGENR